jgi:outer membrane receptor protein involved in Fe transport
MGTGFCFGPSLLTLFACLTFASAAAFSQTEPASLRIGGIIRDQSGGVVAGARVVFRGDNVEAAQTTGADGRFVFESLPVAAGKLRVEAAGFATAEREISAGTRTVELSIVLTPGALIQNVIVTATRTKTRLADTASNVVLLTSEGLAASGALTLDDTLRQVPGFTLFRRSGSRAANPTSQGVSLRGVGASGASRALVLSDGIPLNDPFGGWVYWDRVPRESVERIEVERGGASSLYGSEALGGVVNIIPRRPAWTTLALETSYGNEATPDVSMATSLSTGKWLAQFSGEAFRTDGYVLVDEAERGKVDTPANVNFSTSNFRLERKLSERASLFAGAQVFGESRHNGTPLQTNRTHLRQMVFGADRQSQKLGAMSMRIYGGPQLFDQTFSSITLDRNSESLVRLQRVPAQRAGLEGQWSRTAGSRQTLVAGFAASDVRGSSNELGYTRGALSSASDSTGRQRMVSGFGEDILRVRSRWIVTGGARVDHWRNFAALTTTKPLSRPGPPLVTRFPDRAEGAFSPRLSMLFAVSPRVALTASAYQSFRAPTLNELYRSFRLGNNLTLANSNLQAERLTGGEAGLRLTPLNQRLTLGGTVFWSDIRRPIANLTLSATPALITRQRENLGRTRSRGVDLDWNLDLTRSFALSGGYEFDDATVLKFPANSALVGREIPEVPRNNFTFQARYSNFGAKSPLARLTVAIQGRFVGTQFDDDLNQLPLRHYFVLDAFFSRSLGDNFDLFVAAENVFDQRYAVGRTPVETIGPPTLVRIGIRVHVSGRSGTKSLGPG